MAAHRDVLELLGRQHKLIGALFHQVERTTGPRRGPAFERLVRLLAVHETVEEEIVHPALRRIDDGEPVVEARLAEERAGKEALGELERLGVDAPGFDARLRELHHAVLLHAAQEECHEFPRLRAHLAPGTLVSMAMSLRAAEKVAPTHPHPGVEGATANMLAGPFMALADRVRDALRQDATDGAAGSAG
jgi:hemerythrin superfamily protein